MEPKNEATPESEKSLRYNEGKPDFSILPLIALTGTANVLAKGAKKYARDNWKKPTDEKQTLASALRHLAQDMDGELVDRVEDGGDGEEHIDHVIANLLFIKWHRMKKAGLIK